jgi:hypothetical protein
MFVRQDLVAGDEENTTTIRRRTWRWRLNIPARFRRKWKEAHRAIEQRVKQITKQTTMKPLHKIVARGTNRTLRKRAEEENESHAGPTAGSRRRCAPPQPAGGVLARLLTLPLTFRLGEDAGHQPDRRGAEHFKVLGRKLVPILLHKTMRFVPAMNRNEPQ